MGVNKPAALQSYRTIAHTTSIMAIIKYVIGLCTKCLQKARGKYVL